MKDKLMSDTILDQVSISCSMLIKKLKDNALSELDDQHLISEITTIKNTIDEVSRFYKKQEQK